MAALSWPTRALIDIRQRNRMICCNFSETRNREKEFLQGTHSRLVIGALDAATLERDPGRRASRRCAHCCDRREPGHPPCSSANKGGSQSLLSLNAAVLAASLADVLFPQKEVRTGLKLSRSGRAMHVPPARVGCRWHNLEPQAMGQNKMPLPIMPPTPSLHCYHKVICPR